MKSRTYAQAIGQAKESAKLFGIDYVVFFDTSGNARAARSHLAPCGITGTITAVRADGSTKDYADTTQYAEDN